MDNMKKDAPVMIREEAIEYFESLLKRFEEMYETETSYWGKAHTETTIEATRLALFALRPISREQVEKVWPGCDFCNTADFGEFGFEITKHYAKICCALGSWRFPEKEQFLFCPKCGKPLTDEAVEMVVERLEALNENRD